MKSFILLTLIGLSLTNIIFSQIERRIRVSGQVIDGETGEPLPGANILIKGTINGTITDLGGYYSILVPGEETILLFSFIGYVEQQIIVGNQQTINVQLEMDVTRLDEVIVTSQAKGQIGARQQQINSTTIVNVVALDRLRENPDANAVEAIGRLPGISVLRSGGEGVGLVIRGLEPRYSNITMNGIKLPSTMENERGTNISGISQYVLQGVEVFKALTPDMEANSVGGTVNLKLQETPVGLHYNFMAQGGYNHLNNYIGNYKFLGEISNRFLNNKLGVFLSVNAERVNRSVETMSAGYGLQSSEVDILLNSATLNKITRINSRESATVSLDYQVHTSTKLKLYGLYTHSGFDSKSQSKSYIPIGAGSVNYSQSDDPYRRTDMLHTTLTGETKLRFLNTILDYGIALSYNNTDDPDSRSWSWRFFNASTDEITTIEHRRLDPTEIIPLFDDDVDSLMNSKLSNITKSNSILQDKNLTSFLNIKVPFNIGEALTGYVKFGGQYRIMDRYRDVLSGSMDVYYNAWLSLYALQEIDWLVGTTNGITMINFEDYVVEDYLNGQYDYGWYFDFDRLNEFTSWWTGFSDSLWVLGAPVWMPMLGSAHKIGYSQNLKASMIDDQDIKEFYRAGYLMSEFNIGKWLIVIPGIRYENTKANMKGMIAMQPIQTDPTYKPLPGTDTSETRSDAFLLPMFHMRIKPTNLIYLHMAYTKTLSRPDFNSISPNVYINPSQIPFSYIAQNPHLKAELWTNYDAQLTFHSNKIGLLSLTGFYKTVQDKIWNRSYKRIKGDEIIYPFGDNNVVDVSIWENHPYDIFLRGVELEWQTSFWYKPGLLKYFTLSLNYTYTDSKTKYPFTSLESVTPPEGGRPVTIRIDSTTTGPMLFQPRHIGNASLGFNLKGFNIWLSFQYNGKIYTYKHYVLDDLDRLKEHFYRLDLQLTYDIPVKKLPGKLQLMGNFANLSNFLETSRLRGDPRFTYQEAYGWTADLGVRYRF